MGLTNDDVKALKRPFEVTEHEFKGKEPYVYVYVAEAAVCDRLESVDPSWSLEIVSNEIREDRAEQYAACHARLTVNGVRREGVGMQTHNRDKDGKIMPTELEKGAATDALRRCARLFGVGRYLLNTPKGVKDEKSLTAWLKTLNNANGYKPDAEPAWPDAKLVEQVKEKAMKEFGIAVWSAEFLCGKKFEDFETGHAAYAAIKECVESLRNPQPEVTTASGEPVNTATGEILDAPPAGDDKPTPGYKAAVKRATGKSPFAPLNVAKTLEDVPVSKVDLNRAPE